MRSEAAAPPPLTENHELDRLLVLAVAVLDLEGVEAGVLPLGVGDGELGVVVGVLDVDLVAVGQDGFLVDPFHLGLGLADVVHRPLVAATHLDGDRLEVGAVDARLNCNGKEGAHAVLSKYTFGLYGGALLRTKSNLICS